MNRRRRAGLAPLVFAAALAAVAPIAPGQKPSEPLRLIGGDQMRPILHMHDGEPAGLAADLARAAAERAGLSIRIETASRSQARGRVLAGTADALLSIRLSPEGDGEFAFTDSLLASQALIYRLNTRTDIVDLGSLRAAKIGFCRIDDIQRLWAESDRPRLVEFENLESAFKDLARGLIDAIIADRWMGACEMQRRGECGVAPVHPPLALLDLRIAVEKTNIGLVGRIDAGLREIEADGTRRHILDKWLAEQDAPATLSGGGLLVWGAAVGAGLLAAAALGAWLRTRATRQACLQMTGRNNALAVELDGARASLLRETQSHNQALASLRENEIRLQLAWQASSDVIWDWDVRNDSQRWSGAGAEVFGWRDAVEQPQDSAWWSERVHPEDRPRVLEGFKAFLADPARDHWQDEYRFFRQDGGIAIVHDRGFIFRGADGEPLRMIGAMQDITERRKAEEDLRRERREIELANRILQIFVEEDGFELFDKGLAVVLEGTGSKEGVFGYISEPGHLMCPSLSKMLDECEVAGKCIHYPPEKWKGLWARALRERQSFVVNEPPPVPPGHPIIHNNLAVPIVFQNEAIGLLNLANKEGGYTEEDREAMDGIARRLAPVLYAWIHRKLRDEEREEAEHALKESKERFQTLFETMTEGFALHEILTDGEGRPCDYRFLDLNPAFERLTGLKRADLVGKRVLEALPGTERYWIENYGRVALTGEPLHMEEFSSNLDRWFSIRAYRTAPRKFAVIFSDVTTRKQAEEALAAAHARLGALMNAMPVGISFSDDSTCQRITGNPAALAQFEVHPHDNLSASALDRTAPGRQVRFFRDGLQVDDSELPLQRAVAENKEIPPMELEVLLPSGRRWYTVASGAPIRDSAGNVIGGVAVTVDHTDQKRVEKELAAAKKTAEVANLAKSRFLANMSHELRTPMNAILGMIEVALRKTTDPTALECLRIAGESADLLLALLDGLLDSAKIESGKLELETAPFDLRKMFDYLARIFTIRAREKGLSFTCRVPDDAPETVVGDRIRLQQILFNLIGNAIKFTDHGEVEVGLQASARDGDAFLEFSVRDTGIGISPSGLENLFQPFVQVERSMTKRFGGTGLGLSISKGLVESMNGRIWVESRLGQGSTFHFNVRLPLGDDTGSQPASPAICSVLPVRPLNILLVEDNPANQKFALFILQERGHRVVIAGDGHEAIRLLSNMPTFDIILMDIQMPGMDGITATSVIRNLDRGPVHVPIIALTAHALADDRERCIAAGMDGYLSKPVKAPEMIALIERLADRQAASTRPATSATSQPTQSPRLVFDLQLAKARCFDSEDMVWKMAQYFLEDIDRLFPAMRAALDRFDLTEIGKLGHRMKGTVAYLGAEPATEAARSVERLSNAPGITQSEAEGLVDALEHECLALKSLLAGLAPPPAR